MERAMEERAMTTDPTTPTGDAAISEILAWLRREAHGHTMAHE